MEFPQKDSKISLFKVTIYEFIGTFFLTVTINISAREPFDIGFMYFILILMCKDISGAHFNPAITLAVYLFEGRWTSNLKWIGLYSLAQYGGAFLGTYYAHLIKPNKTE
jgi:aquaporin Z